MDLGSSTTATLVVVALAAAVLATALGVGAHVRLTRLQARHRFLWDGGDHAGGGTDLTTVLSDQSREIAMLRGDVVALSAELTRTAGDIEQSLRHVAVVRYDAFGDMGGRLSSSAAIVDDRGDGLVISSIHARGESRTYAKGVVDGDGEVTLTPEEQQALAAARTGEGDS